MAEEKRNWLGPYIPEGSVIREIVQQFRLVYNLMLDGRVPALTKLIPVAAVAYLFFPVDVVPDILVGLGQLDDLAILMLGFRFFLEFAPPNVVHEHLKRIAQSGHWSAVDNPPAEPRQPDSGGEVVDGSFRVEDDKPSQ
jgi:uncharacterized membrane protein YkvA (DUF1232 family)